VTAADPATAGYFVAMRGSDDDRAGMRVLRISHSGVVAAWRERERALRRRGVDLELVSAQAWDEGGAMVTLDPTDDSFVSGVRTWGHHPSVFVFDPRPLWRLLGREWDVIDIHEEPGSLAVAEILLLRWMRRQDAPYLLYSAQNIPKRYPPPFRWTEAAALRRAAAVSVCNVAAGGIVRDKGLLGPAVTVPLGVDVDRFSPVGHPAPSGSLRLGYVGRLEDHKGVDVLVDAMATGPSWRLEIIGGGPAETALRDRVERLGLGDRVRFTGHVGADGLPAAYRSFDVLVVPSVDTDSWSEQFCRVAVEAMASGVPVVASRAGAIPEVVADAGLLVDQRDPAALAAALGSLADDADRWEELRRRGVARAAGFSWEAVADTYRSLYRRVAAGPGAGRRPAAGIDGPQSGLDVVVVAYGPPDVLGTCLAALAGTVRPIVVDNSSLPATRELVERHGGVYVDPGRNLGFAAGVNLGLRHRRHDGDVLLLNPDAVITPEAIGRLRRRLVDDPTLGVVAPAQVDPADGTPAQILWPVPTPTGAWLDAVGLGRWRGRREFAIGSVLLLRGATLADVGPLDERFFLYAEETDWEIRAMQRGWGITVETGAVATHLGAGTGGDPTRRETHFHASHERLIRKHAGTAGWLIFRAGTMAGAAVRMATRSGDRRAEAARRLALYRSGPVQAEERMDAGDRIAGAS
jgi:glycosyltransferase involved in cell wall biosynthesis/GT2 family glycosyltransferase